MRRIPFSLLMMIGAYPLITGILYGLGAQLAPLAVWQRTLIIVPLMVIGMVYLITPVAQTLLRRF